MKTFQKITKIGIALFLFTVGAFNVVPFLEMTPGQDLQAVVSLPTDLHPDYAPEINVNAKNEDQPIEAVYANAVLQFIAGGLLYLAGPVAILVIAIAGLRYVTAHGNQNLMDGAKKTLTYAVVGLIVIIFSFAIIRAIISAITSAG